MPFWLEFLTRFCWWLCLRMNAPMLKLDSFEWPKSFYPLRMRSLERYARELLLTLELTCSSLGAYSVEVLPIASERRTSEPRMIWTPRACPVFLVLPG